MKNKNSVREKVLKESIKEHDIKCPYCGNLVNWKTPIKFNEKTKTVWFVAECWSGELGKDDPRHQFLIKIDHLLVTEFDNYVLDYETND